MNLPTLTTQAVSEIAPTTAKANGTITAIGVGNANKRGFVYSLTTHSDPGNVHPGNSGYSNYVEESGSFPAAAFEIEFSGLAKNTQYFVRAYAHNADGYAYGGEVDFTTLLEIFPDEIYSPRVKSNKAGVNYDSAVPSTLFADDLTKLDDEVVSIETILGVNVSGPFSTVYDWLLSIWTALFSPTGATYTPDSGSKTVALNVGNTNIHIVSGHANGTAITFTITGAQNNQPFIVSILQGGTTSSTIVAWFSTIRWAGGSAPTLTATLGKRDTFGFIRTGSNTYDGFVIGQNC
jgi:hypothetical protein